MMRVAVVALSLVAAAAGQFSTDMAITSPTTGDNILSTSSISVTWTINNAQGFSNIVTPPPNVTHANSGSLDRGVT